MDKKKPKIFVNKIEKDLKNNEKFYYSNNVEEKEPKKETSVNLKGKNVSQKISEIFSSTRYVYKADVDIKLKDKDIKTKIIGHNRTHLITIDNELIPITDIIDINYSN